MQQVCPSCSPQKELLSWPWLSPSGPYTGFCGGTGSGCGHGGGPCRSTALLPSSAPASDSGCCCCSVRPSPPRSWSGPPLSPLYRPPPSSPRLPGERSRSAGRPAWPSPQRAPQRRGEAERLRAGPWSQLEGRAETHNEQINFHCRTDSGTWHSYDTWLSQHYCVLAVFYHTVIRQRRAGKKWDEMRAFANKTKWH